MTEQLVLLAESMNYYERYCGDYMRDTAHLSLTQHGAYSVLLDIYYATERAFPSDYSSLYRICRAMSKPEQDAVREVADEFFPVAADGLRHNERADREIDKARDRIDTARLNGKSGGRPKKPIENPAGNPTGNPLGSQTETHQQPAGKAHQTPDPNSKNLTALGGDATPPNPFLEAWKIYPKRSGNNPRYDAQKAWNARLKCGATPEEMIDGLGRYKKWCEATGKIGTETVMRASTFFGPSKPFEQDWELPKKSANGAAVQWWSSEAGIIAKGLELGLNPRPGEQMSDFRGRINVALAPV